MKLRIVGIALLALGLTGCVTSQQMDRHRTYVQTVNHVKMPDDTYRVYDHKTDNSLLVSPSMNSIVGIGMAQGVTLGLADTMTPEQKLEAAAQQRLNETGRGNCKITKGYMFVKPLYEFWYECA